MDSERDVEHGKPILSEHLVGCLLRVVVVLRNRRNNFSIVLILKGDVFTLCSLLLV